MSQAFKCDACGEYYDGIPDLYDGSLVVRKRHFFSYHFTNDLEWKREVCPECSKKIKDILHIQDKDEPRYV